MKRHRVEILCELLNPNHHTKASKLWHVDFKTGRRTPISRLLLNASLNDAPDIFKRNRNKRLEYVKRNHLRIRFLQLEDSARYECNCSDCDEELDKQTKELQVLKLIEPKWYIEPSWPMQEHAKTAIKYF
ncbi:unnamed protein product [Rotaria sordida]|uniref:Ig-like domain-containing protein n=1 Tax=Rotaria sordida TaxID=392033 RepID=A0A815ZGC4_9BILA|nr:unnamed protein product [Rotaria sordida]CAF1583743.1 unnamed protein product [Rotaria sordida]